MVVVVEVAFRKVRMTAKVREVEHGADLKGLNIVAVLDGEFHKAGCEWCKNLEERAAVRRQA